MRDGLNTLMQKRMDRRGFLEVIGLGLLGFIGVSRLLEAFQPGSQLTTPACTSSTGAYGSSAYGGGTTSTDQPNRAPAKIGL